MDTLQVCIVAFALLFAWGGVRLFMEQLDGVFFFGIGVIGILVCAFIMGVDTSPRSTDIDREKVPVIYSRTNDGCVVYRFVASGRERFFTRCTNSNTTDTMHSESCGKNCTQDVSHPTETIK